MDLNKEIKSLAMLKLEKNFIAHNQKGYPRKPYQNGNTDAENVLFFLRRVKEETNELQEAIEKIIVCRDKTHDIAEIKSEIADVSNLLDFMFESISRLEPYWWNKYPSEFPKLNALFSELGDNKRRLNHDQTLQSSV